MSWLATFSSLHRWILETFTAWKRDVRNWTLQGFCRRLTRLLLMCPSAGNCTNYQQEFERVFSVPGQMAMLNSTLVTPTVFNYTAEPYTITWYDTRTGREVSSEAGRILVRGETLWFLNVTLDDSGEYLTVVRCRSGEERFSHVVLSLLHTHNNTIMFLFVFFFFTRTSTWCYKQITVLVVEPPVLAECRRPRTAHQMLTNRVNTCLTCPLRDCMDKLESYNVSYSLKWYKVSGTQFNQLFKMRYFWIKKSWLSLHSSFLVSGLWPHWGWSWPVCVRA